MSLRAWLLALLLALLVWSVIAGLTYLAARLLTGLLA